MTDNEARQLVGLLVAGTHGWTDESVDLYVAELACLARFDVAAVAVRGVVRTHTKPGRPPLAVILEAYRREMDRQTTPALSPRRDSYMPAAEGMLIAWRAYAEECKRAGKEPNRALFGGVMDSVKESSS